MRELTKSLFSFSYALSLFGIQQTANLLSPAKAAKAFDCMTQATESQMNDSLKSTFEAGDRMQRSAWDLMLGFFSRDAINPTRMMRMTADAARESASAMSQGMQGITSTMRQATSAAMSQNPGMGAPSGASSVEDPQDWASGINNCNA
jgi:hypothetical protein